MEKVCIICAEKKDGIEVEDTAVIKLIRKIKRKLSIAQNNQLVVCYDHLEDYKKKRQDFEKKLILNGLLGAFFFAIAFILPLLSGRFDISSFIVAALLMAFLLLLSMLVYIPPIKKGYEDHLPSQNKKSKTDEKKEHKSISEHKNRQIKNKSSPSHSKNKKSHKKKK
jgi:hypothetical protein